MPPASIFHWLRRLLIRYSALWTLGRGLGALEIAFQLCHLLLALGCVWSWSCSSGVNLGDWL